jgi:hypothetical protein
MRAFCCVVCCSFIRILGPLEPTACGPSVFFCFGMQSVNHHACLFLLACRVLGFSRFRTQRTVLSLRLRCIVLLTVLEQSCFSSLPSCPFTYIKTLPFSAQVKLSLNHCIGVGRNPYISVERIMPAGTHLLMSTVDNRQLYLSRSTRRELGANADRMQSCTV